MNRFTVQTYFTKSGEWVDDVSFPTITEAVNYYLEYRTEYPNIEYRIVQILEVE